MNDSSCACVETTWVQASSYITEPTLVVGGNLHKMATCPISCPKRMGCMPKTFPQNKYVTNEKRKYMLKGEGQQVQKVGIMGELGGGGMHGAKAMTWHDH